MRPVEIIFEVTEAGEGGYDVRALGYSIFTQGEDWAELKAMVKDAVLCHFDNDSVPRVIRLHLVKDAGYRSMRLPRDLSGDDLVGLRHRHYGYRLIRQRGSHMTLTATIRGTEHNVTIPRHRQITCGDIKFDNVRCR